MIFYDTESVGLTGPITLIQYAIDNGPITLFEPWKEPVSATLRLIESFMDHEEGVVGFNLTHDSFQLSKTYNLWQEMTRAGLDYPTMEAYKHLESRISADALALKPHKACDLMLVARRGKYQSTMGRKNIRIKRIPIVASEDLLKVLECRVELPEIYFHRNTGERWKIMPDEEDPEWCDLVLRFSSSTSLGALARDALGEEKCEWPIPKDLLPKEKGYKPFGWWEPDHFHRSLEYWHNDETAREYARIDVHLTRRLWQALGCPEPGDDDSELACSVGTCRWRGWAIDTNEISRLQEENEKLARSAPTSPNGARAAMEAVMDELELLCLPDTAKETLAPISLWENDAGQCAREIIKARTAEKRLDVLKKLAEAGRAFFDFKVIGAKSGRMSGTGSLNPQGIDRTLRHCFPLADGGLTLTGGDFDSFEVAIAAAVYNDPGLTEQIQSGVKIHALMAADLFEMSYEDVMKTKGTDRDLYSIGKQVVFGSLYGAQPFKIAQITGLDEERTAAALAAFYGRYPKALEAREKIFKSFTALTQPDGIGTAVIYNKPAEYAETLDGYRRYFTLENELIRVLFGLSQTLPIGGYGPKKVRRREREQTVRGACQSALYAAAFNVQGQNQRAGGNHEIQGSGAEVTKNLQRRLWDVQPAGIHPFECQPFNVHDEVMNPVRNPQKSFDVVENVLEENRPRIPLIAMDYTTLNSWEEK